MPRKSKTDLVYHLGRPTFLYVEWEDYKNWYKDWHDAEGRKIDPPKMELVRSDDGESELSKALKYRLDTFLIDGGEYTLIRYAEGTDGNDHTRREYGYWPTEKVYSIDPNILMNVKSIRYLDITLGKPAFEKSGWFNENSDEYITEWEDYDGNAVDPPDAGLVRLDFSSQIARACGVSFAICKIYDKEYVVFSLGWDEFGSGSEGYWPIEKLYSIDPDSLDDYE